MVVGEAWPEDLPGAAIDLLIAGLDTPSLRMLAGADGSDGEAVRALLAAVVSESGREMPDIDRARRVVAEEWVKELADGSGDPYLLCREIWWKAWNLGGDRDGDLAPFVNLATEWEEANLGTEWERLAVDRRPAIEEDMRQAARAFLGRS